MRLLLATLLTTVVAAGCDDTSDMQPEQPPPATPDAGSPDAIPATTIELQLAHAAFPPPQPTLPNAIVHVPAGFSPSLPLDLVVYLHGWSNCIQNAIRTNPGTCVPGGATHGSYALLDQLAASKKNAVLFVPELEFEQPSSAIGQLATKDDFVELVDEALKDPRVAALVGGRTAAQVDQILIASHSGAYTAASAIVTVGGMQIAETWLLDSLYGDEASFNGWITGDKDLFVAPWQHRFATIYTLGGGTLANSQSMATTAVSWFPSDTSTVILDDRTTDTLTADQYAEGLIFKRSALAHDDVPRYYFQKMLETSRIPDRP
jgi:hypothetical protein